MRFAKNLLMSIGAVALAAGLVNVIAPQAVHAAVAALVQVSNPATSPVLNSRIDDPGRIPYQNVAQCQNTNFCSLAPQPVPANHRLVVEHVSAQFESASATAGQCDFSVSVVLGPLQAYGSFLMPPSVFVPNSNISGSNQSIRVSVDPNELFLFECRANTTLQAAFLGVSGYLLDCNAAPCAAIASF
jgi:hypothetical protein